MQPTESALCLGTLTFQVAGVAALGVGMLCRGDKPKSIRLMLLLCLVGLGSVTVLSAIQQSSAALTSGLTLTVLMLGAIYPLSHEFHGDPYASIYPPEN